MLFNYDKSDVSSKFPMPKSMRKYNSQNSIEVSSKNLKIFIKFLVVRKYFISDKSSIGKHMHLLQYTSSFHEEAQLSGSITNGVPIAVTITYQTFQ